MTDSVIEFKIEDDKRFLKVSKMKKTKHEKQWVEFDITKTCNAYQNLYVREINSIKN